MNKSVIAKGVTALWDSVKEMDYPTARRLYDISFAALHPVFLERVLNQMPFNETENELYAQMVSAPFVAVVVRKVCKARIKELGHWVEVKADYGKKQDSEK